ncbi:hypothetical protein F4801DRAFT_99528 [Xylaria longipes]|nr:hypothetical protein F4801DRAFT_99528 [Xylaria longipes]
MAGSPRLEPLAFIRDLPFLGTKSAMIGRETCTRDLAATHLVLSRPVLSRCLAHRRANLTQLAAVSSLLHHDSSRRRSTREQETARTPAADPSYLALLTSSTSSTSNVKLILLGHDIPYKRNGSWRWWQQGLLLVGRLSHHHATAQAGYNKTIHSHSHMRMLAECTREKDRSITQQATCPLTYAFVTSCPATRSTRPIRSIRDIAVCDPFVSDQQSQPLIYLECELGFIAFANPRGYIDPLSLLNTVL